MLRKTEGSSGSKESYDETKVLVQRLQLWGWFLLSKR